MNDKEKKRKKVREREREMKCRRMLIPEKEGGWGNR
jgi:hypothetical protein